MQVGLLLDILFHIKFAALEASRSLVRYLFLMKFAILEASKSLVRYLFLLSLLHLKQVGLLLDICSF